MDLYPEAVNEISGELRHLLSDVFVLYVKTKNFHWHVTGHHFRDYHLLLDQQGEEIFSMTDAIAERARKIGATTLRSLEEISKFRRLKDNSEDFVTPNDMLQELCQDNQSLVRFMRAAHETCERHNDFATASALENWIDQSERRIWFLFASKQNP